MESTRRDRKHLSHSTRGPHMHPINNAGANNPLQKITPTPARKVRQREDVPMECVSRKCKAEGARIESLEGRTLMSVTGLPDHGLDGGPGVTSVYVESNNPEPGQNAVIAFRRNPADGALRQIGKFQTGGTR